MQIFCMLIQVLDTHVLGFKELRTFYNFLDALYVLIFAQVDMFSDYTVILLTPVLFPPLACFFPSNSR
jgi:hypothetical protein